jgi:hypothetical protein
MLARSALKPVFVSLFGIAALAACGSTPDTGEGTGEVSQASITPCPSCIPPLGPPITVITPTIDVGSVAQDDDPENGRRTGTAYVIVPSTGFLQASIPNAYSEWKLVDVYDVNRAGAPVITTSSTGAPVETIPVTKGDEVEIDVQFNVSEAAPLGPLSTSISIWNALSSAAVKLTSDSTTYPPNTPVFFFDQQSVCTKTAPVTLDLQLGNATSPCTGPDSTGMNDAREQFVVRNAGTGAGTVAFAASDLAVQESEHIQVECTPAFPSSIAAGATFATNCELHAIAPFVAATQVKVPFNLVANGLRGGEEFFEMVDIVATSSGSGGGGGGSPPASCTQSGNKCTPGANSDGCLSDCETVCYVNGTPIVSSCTPITGTFCNLPPSGTLGCVAACGPQAVSDCSHIQ